MRTLEPAEICGDNKNKRKERWKRGIFPTSGPRGPYVRARLFRRTDLAIMFARQRDLEKNRLLLGNRTSGRFGWSPVDPAVGVKNSRAAERGARP